MDGGVLDTKWLEHPLDNGAAVLACATSVGRVVLYTLRDEGEDAEAKFQMVSSSNGDSDMLLLSLDWSGGTYADAKVGKKKLGMLSYCPENTDDIGLPHMPGLIFCRTIVGAHHTYR